LIRFSKALQLRKRIYHIIHVRAIAIMELKRVVVTGIGALTPIGNSLKDYWENLLGGVSGADMITLFDASKFKTRFACELKNYDPLSFLDKKEARRLLQMPILQKIM
jgi:3-oxoacyl-(acyl-carrier-protein) synthase